MKDTMTTDEQKDLDTQSLVRDANRLDAVRRTELLDTPSEETFDRLTRIGAEMVGVPVTFISLVDETRDFYKSCYGFGPELTERRELSGTTFCHYAIQSTEPLVIDDTRADPVYRTVPTVETLGVAAYLGVPLTLSTGETIGSFCAIDMEPRKWSERDVRVMKELAFSTLREIELRMALRTAEKFAGEAEEAHAFASRREAEIRGRHQLILDATADGIFGLDQNGLVTFVNPAAARILGYEQEELHGLDQHATVHYLRADGTPLPKNECPIHGVLSDGMSRGGDQDVFVRRDGTLVPIEFTCQAIPEEDGTGGVVVTFRDQTQRLAEKDRERALADEREARAAAEAAARAREEFFAVLSHELRTPMTSIRGWLQILRDKDVDEATQQMAFDAIDTSSRVQAQLIDDLLDVTRIAQGKLKLDLKPVRLEQLVPKATEQFIPEAKARGINIRIDVSEQDVEVIADASRIEQILNNIISNALKFTPRGGLISVQLRKDATHAQVRVRDTGKGISADFLPLVFDRYRQAESGALGGLGLGLTIVRHLVEAHGGTIDVLSDGEGKGSVFTVRLPLRGGS